MRRLPKRSFLAFLLLLLSPQLRAEEAIPLPTDAEILAKIRAEIKGQPDYYRRDVRRAGNRTIELETVLSMPVDLKYAPAIFSDYTKYADWVLPGINERPSGGTFLVQFTDITIPPATPDHVVLGFKIDIPFFRKRRERTFIMSTESKKDVFTLRGETVKAADNVIAGGGAVMKIFPNDADPSQSWGYVKGHVRIESVIVYEALPEKILARETGERIRVLLENYTKEEAKKRGVKSSRGPTEKKAVGAG